MPPPPENKRKEKRTMNVLHLLVSGGTGGIEILMKNYAQHSTHRNIFVFAWKSGDVAKMMEQNGVPVYTTDAGNDGIWTTLKKIRQICLLEKADVVVSHNSAPLLKLALIYIKLTIPGVHTVAYAHANAWDICDSNRKKGLWFRKTVQYLGFRMADGIVAISDSVKKSLQNNLHINPDKVRRIYNGTPLNSEMICSGKNRESTGLMLIYVGRLIREKGIHVTLQKLAEIQEEIPFSFTIVGDGPYRKELEDLVSELDLSTQVCFLGQRMDVQSLLREADVFVHLPVWEEGFGITVIEAMASGLICVVNKRGSLPEIIQNDVNGFVIDENPETLKNTLRHLLDMPSDEWFRFQDAVYSRAEDFSIDAFAKTLDQYFLEICRTQNGLA